jgi:hypothetical protein
VRANKAVKIRRMEIRTEEHSRRPSADVVAAAWLGVTIRRCVWVLVARLRPGVLGGFGPSSLFRGLGQHYWRLVDEGRI